MHYWFLRIVHSSLTAFVLLIIVFSLIISPIPISLYPSTSTLLSTLASKPLQNSFTFVFLGGNDNGDTMFYQVLASANQPHPAFILDGDPPALIGTQGEYNQFSWMLRQSEAPVIMLGESRNITGLGRYIFNRSFTSTNFQTGLADYAFEYSGVRFVLMDDIAGNLSNRQLGWLENVLHTTKRKIIAMQVPAQGTRNTGRFLDIVQRNAVDLVLLSTSHSGTALILTNGRDVTQSFSHASTDQYTSANIVLVHVSSNTISFTMSDAPVGRNAVEYVILLVTGGLIIIGWFLFGILWRILRVGGSIQRKSSIRRSSYGFLPPGTLDFIILGALSLASWTNGTIYLRSAETLTLLNIVGCLIVLSGLLFAAWARLRLGRFWSGSRAVIQDHHQIITDGPYQYVRHPIYVGEILMALGTSIWAANWLLLLVLFGGVTLYNFYRAHIEETLFVEELGIEYLRYQRCVPMLIPARIKINHELGK